MAVHRWLGIALGALVIAWFGSGLVMLWHGMPELTSDQRLEHQEREPPLDLSAALAPGEAFQRAGLAPATGDRADLPRGTIDVDDVTIETITIDTVTIETVLGRPVYRARYGGRPVTLWADDGALLQGLSRASALEIAARHLATAGDLPQWRHRRLERPDQWTLQARALLPFHRFTFEDDAGTAVYVSERTGRVELTTDRSSRTWGFLGPVIHWVYFTPLRRHSALWLDGMIWASAAGLALIASGWAWGAWVWVRQRRLPYRGFLRWHHLAGLVFGAAALAWMLSGLLSLDPWTWQPGTSPDVDQRRAAAGAAVDLGEVTASGLRDAVEILSGEAPPRELELGAFEGVPFVLARGAGGTRRVVWLEEARAAPAPPPTASPQAAFRRTEPARETLLAAAGRALPGHRIVAAERLEHGDAYYYRNTYGDPSRRPLPVLRVRFDDPASTALYLDPLTGQLLHREQRRTRLHRWLYHGLHSWDHPALLRRPALRLALMVVFLAGGLLTAASAAVPGCRRLWARIVPTSRRPAASA